MDNLHTRTYMKSSAPKKSLTNQSTFGNNRQTGSIVTAKENLNHYQSGIESNRHTVSLVKGQHHEHIQVTQLGETLSCKTSEEFF